MFVNFVKTTGQEMKYNVTFKPCLNEFIEFGYDGWEGTFVVINIIHSLAEKQVITIFVEEV